MKRKNLSFEWNSILRDVVKNFWVVILSGLIGFFGFYVLTYGSYKPVYTSKATLSVTTANGTTSTYSSLAVSSEMATVFTTLLDDPLLTERAAEVLGKDSFDGTLSFSVIENTNLLEVRVDSDNPVKSYYLLNAVLTVHPEISEKIFNNANIHTLRTPDVPTGPSNSVSDQNSSLVVAACVILSFSAIVLLSLLRNTVKKESDFDEKIESKLIGTIVHESKKMTLNEIKQKKKKGLLIHSNAYISLRFTENFHKIAAKLEHKKKRGDGSVYAVTSVAENEGKSTCAANIAVSLADRGNKVALVDLDFKKPALYKIFDETPVEGSSLNDLLSGNIAFEDFEFVHFKKLPLSLVINSAPNPSGKNHIADGNVENLIERLKKDFDFVIIDTAPLSLDSSVTDIIRKVDKTILIIRTDTVNVNVINDHITTITKISKNLAGCILNNVYMSLLPFSITGNDESGRYGSYGYGKYHRYGHYGHYSRYGHYGHYAKQRTSAEAEESAIVAASYSDTTGSK